MSLFFAGVAVGLGIGLVIGTINGAGFSKRQYANSLDWHTRMRDSAYDALGKANDKIREWREEAEALEENAGTLLRDRHQFFEENAELRVQIAVAEQAKEEYRVSNTQLNEECIELQKRVRTAKDYLNGFSESGKT